ncbi:MAG: bifunctional pyr operon transcriptional regulator/uracil phosphoribosyltransferase PyrR [Candidatus Protistobacter heckmanni]|nr:bifunctional pyr operon transcriptional regulator/uracil phosphoribosyltransferase PyrR [Candidatus Protistobacter heckmanni]
MTTAPDAEQLYARLRELVKAGQGAGLAVAGIHSGGAWVAARLAADLGLGECGVINVAFHRDDYAKKGLHSKAAPTSIPFDVNGRRILLVDDVLQSGRTVRAAINELFDYGRPAAVELAVLADRQEPGNRQLPFAPTYAGATLSLPPESVLALSASGEGANTKFAFTIEARGA